MLGVGGVGNVVVKGSKVSDFCFCLFVIGFVILLLCLVMVFVLFVGYRFCVF